MSSGSLATWLKNVAMMTNGLGDGRETDGCRDLIIPDELMPLALQQLSLALHMEGLKGSGVDREESPGFGCV